MNSSRTLARRQVRPPSPGLGGASPIALLVWLILVGLPVAPVSAASFLEVTQTPAGFSIEAEEISLTKILRAIGSKAGFEVVDTTGSSETLALFSIADRPLDKTLESLLVKQNHLIVYSPGKEPAQAGKISKIILMRPSTGPRTAAQRSLNASPLAGPGAKTSLTTRPQEAANRAKGIGKTNTAEAPGARTPSEAFEDPAEEFDSLLDDLDPEDADEIRQALQAEFLANEQ